MRALIRFLSRGAAGTVEQRDRTFAGEAITLGRATDQVLHLRDRRVELEHARIFLRGDRILISSAAIAGVTVNGAVCRDAALRPGDVVAIGSNTLRFFAPPPDFDVAFSFELDAAARVTEAARERPVLDLAATRMAKRPWAWILFIAIGAACLIVPALGMKEEGLGGTLRARGLPNDGWWISGALSPAHQNIGTACESCHALPFVRVRNQECLACHAPTLHGHGSAGLDHLRAERCTACHVEHNEPTTLVRRDARVCADCHRDLARVVAEGIEVQPATDFVALHPEFRVALTLPTKQGPLVEQRMRLDSAAGQERSGLAFPHDVHLDPAGVKSPEGKVVMACGDCHQPEEGGGRMQPIAMERHCASCHRLDFEPADPERTVPHGDAAGVLRTLLEYYSARYLEEYPDPHATSRPERLAARPGVELTAAQRTRALERARTKALATARDLFERRTCHQCHQVTAATAEDGSPTWIVAPTMLARRWMPKAHFSHERHSTALTECSTCHSAADSQAASDVLMPGIATCRECHGGSAVAATPAANLVPSDCALCHFFHDPDSERWVSNP